MEHRVGRAGGGIWLFCVAMVRRAARPGIFHRLCDRESAERGLTCFVFLVIFRAFQVDERVQHRVLEWGIIARW